MPKSIPVSTDQPILLAPSVIPIERTGELRYAPVYNRVHGGDRVLGETAQEMIKAGLPQVVGYTRCPEEVKSVGPWVSVYHGKHESVKGVNDLNQLANLCDQKPNCLGFNAYLNDGNLYHVNQGKTEHLNTSGLRWMPIYLRNDRFKGCQKGTNFFANN